MSGVPVISLRGSSSRDFVRALREHGFLVLADHGIPKNVLSNAMKKSTQMFETSDTIKQKMRLRGVSTGFRGFQTCGQNVTLGKADQHEGLDLMRELAPSEVKDPDSFLCKPNLWPEEKEVPGFRSALGEYTNEMTSLGFRIMDKVVQGLEGTPAQGRCTPDLFNDPFWIMRAIKYPPSKTGEAEEQGVGEHRDYGLLTMIMADDTPGCLQIKRSSGEWEFVDPVENCLVINIGDVLDFWTDGYFKATPHRVMAPRTQTRISLPFFFEPNLEAQIHPDGSTYYDHVLSKLTTNFADDQP